ncbi:hypothetical protein [Embleya sp. NBC_00896]|uniref:hypothetical protein n=1 Tax=Embleya sp. NBC_00896 TaxID=2975961 RepID=UPI00386FF07D
MDEFVEGAGFDEASGVHDQDAVGDAVGDADVGEAVGDEDGGAAVPWVEPTMTLS